MERQVELANKALADYRVALIADPIAAIADRGDAAMRAAADQRVGMLLLVELHDGGLDAAIATASKALVHAAEKAGSPASSPATNALNVELAAAWARALRALRLYV